MIKLQCGASIDAEAIAEGLVPLFYELQPLKDYVIAFRLGMLPNPLIEALRRELIRKSIDLIVERLGAEPPPQPDPFMNQMWNLLFKGSEPWRKWFVREAMAECTDALTKALAARLGSRVV